MDRLENTSASGEQIIFLENMADLAVFFLLETVEKNDWQKYGQRMTYCPDTPSTVYINLIV